MAIDPQSIITEEIRSWIGHTSPPVALPEAISASDVRRYVQATGDANPLWLDEEFARAAGYRGRVVPPIMVKELSWRLGGERGEGRGTRDDRKIPFPPEYTDNRNAGSEVEWLRPVYLGDQLTIQEKICDIVARHGRAGLAIYVTRESEFRNDAGEVVLRRRTTTVKLPRSSIEERTGSREK